MSDDTPRAINVSKRGDDLLLDGEWPQISEFATDILAAIPEIKTTITVTLTHESAVYEVTGVARVASDTKGVVALLAKLIEVKP